MLSDENSLRRGREGRGGGGAFVFVGVNSVLALKRVQLLVLGGLVVVCGVVQASASRLAFLSTHLRWMKLRMKSSSLPLLVFFGQS